MYYHNLYRITHVNYLYVFSFFYYLRINIFYTREASLPALFLPSYTDNAIMISFEKRNYVEREHNIMPPLYDLLFGFLDGLAGHLALTAYLLAVTDEQAVWRRLKKLPPLLLSPLAVVLLTVGLNAVPELETFQYFIFSFAILVMCTVWVRWAWQFGFWRAFAATCMASIFQVATTALCAMLFWIVLLGERNLPAVLLMGLHVIISIAAALLLYKLRFGMWFCLLLDNESAIWRTALLLFALDATVEMFYFMVNGVRPQYLLLYYLLLAFMVVLMTALIVYLAQRFDAARKMQAQQDIIAQQRLYEQDLETIRREVRAFRHDYKNLLAGLSQQAGAGELEDLRRTLSALDLGFDLRLGKKIQSSTQIGNLQIPEVRSLLLNKLAAMQEKGVECRLEVLYPVVAVDMDVWDFVRCLGILIDNAMEAAMDAEKPWVEILLLAQDGQVFFRISNPYENNIVPEKMWNDGWSTKGTGRGVGLHSYQRILGRHPNASPCTGWENGVFVQELTVEGRL